MSSFLKPKKGSRIWQSNRQGKTESSLPTELYLTCSQLPLDRFIKCLVDSDYNSLIIKGAPSSEEISEAWDRIYIEYIQLNQSNETIYSLKLQSEIGLLADEVTRVEEIIYWISPANISLCNGRESELVDILKYYGYKQTIDFTGDYTKSLSAIRNRLNPKKLRLQSRIQELTDYLKSQVSGKPERSVFETNLMRMSRFQGYHVRAKEITVSEYVMIFKDCLASTSKKEGAE